MAFHLLPLNASYESRMVPCTKTGYGHRHQRHKEEYTSALCGTEIIKDGGNYCNVSLYRDGLRPSNRETSRFHALKARPSL